MDLLFAFLSGILGALSPCTVVLIPLVLYRFIERKERQMKNLFLLSTGFISIFIVAGIVFTGIFQSDIQNGIRLGLGIFFVAFGVLSFFEKINPMGFPIVKNPFLLGSVFALATSINPCTLPFLGITIGLDYAQALPAMVVFGIGMLVPSMSFAIFGNEVLNFAKKSGKVVHNAGKLANLILVLAGIYMMVTIRQFTKIDAFAAAVLMIGIFAIVLKIMLSIKAKNEIAKTHTAMLVLALGLIVLAAIFHCSTYATDNTSIQAMACHPGLFSESCDACVRCAVIFGFAAAIGFGAILWAHYAGSIGREE